MRREGIIEIGQMEINSSLCFVHVEYIVCICVSNLIQRKSSESGGVSIVVKLY